jgi:hypothetical protein
LKTTTERLKIAGNTLTHLQANSHHHNSKQGSISLMQPSSSCSCTIRGTMSHGGDARVRNRKVVQMLMRRSI